MPQLHSIYLTGGLPREDSLPFRIASNLQSFRAAHPNLPHTVYDDDSLRDFIRTNMGGDVLQAFDTLLPLAYKADLGRYCLLLELGGIYADLSVHFFQPIVRAGRLSKLHIFRDSFSAAPWIVSNSIIACQPGMPLFQLMIDQIIEHCRTRHYGLNPLCPTGPNLFGRTLATAVPLEQIVCGETTRINRNPFHSHAYLSGDGDVIAISVKKGTGLSSLGARVHDDYNRQYEARNVYGELAGRLSWGRADLARSRRISASMAQQRIWTLGPGTGLLGPAVALGAGEYEGIFSFHSIAPARAPLEIVIDAVCDGGQQILQASEVWPVATGQKQIARGVRFKLDKTTRDVEIRLHLSDSAMIEFSNLRIARISGQQLDYSRAIPTDARQAQPQFDS